MPRTLVLLILALLSVAGAWALRGSVGRLRDAELFLYDIHFRALGDVPPDPRVVIVGMEPQTPEVLARPGAVSGVAPMENPFYPLPRRFHARLLDELRRGGARAVGFDLMFSAETDDDPMFSKAISAHGNVVAALRPQTRLQNGVEEATFERPTTTLGAKLFPASILVPRAFDNRVRWIDAFRADDKLPGVRWPHLGLAVVAAYHGDLSETPTVADAFRWGNKLDLPLYDPQASSVLIRYCGPSGTVPSVAYEDVVSGVWRKKHGAEFFRGKIVLVGLLDPLEDRHLTTRGDMSGTELLAQIASAALSGRGIRPAAPMLVLFCAVVGVFLIAATIRRFSLFAGVGVGVALAILWIGVAHNLFVNGALWIESVPPLLSIALFLLFAAPYELRRTRSALRSLLPGWAYRDAIGGESVGASGKDTSVSVVFCDIRGFTAFCESHSPDEIEAMLRGYFGAGDSLARRFGTQLDKYVGDQIMLYFEPPTRAARGDASLPHEARAVLWADAMRGELAALGIEVAIGIASGVARKGYIGAPGRLQATVIGDVVNLAARLEEATRAVGRPTLIDAPTFSQLPDGSGFEPLAPLVVRGKQKPVEVYARAAVDLAVARAEEKP